MCFCLVGARALNERDILKVTGLPLRQRPAPGSCPVPGLMRTRICLRTRPATTPVALSRLPAFRFQGGEAEFPMLASTVLRRSAQDQHLRELSERRLTS